MEHVFRLHYRATVIIFLAAIALVSDDDDDADDDDYDGGDITDVYDDFDDCPQITSGQFIGNPIHCMSDSVSE